MSSKAHFSVSQRRSALARLTPFGKFLIIFGAVLLALILFAGGRWTLGQWPVWFPEETPTPVVAATEEATVVATATPVPTPVPTETVTTTVAFPAYWADGMYQDAIGDWWPAESVRVAVQTMVQEQYEECGELLGGNDIEVFENVTTEQVRMCNTGKSFDGWMWNWKNYLDNGQFNHLTEIVDESLLLVQGFSPDGLTCQLSETMTSAHLLEYDPDTGEWVRLEIPADGILDGTQYLGVAVVEMKYDPGDGRWKINQFLKWIPRP